MQRQIAMNTAPLRSRSGGNEPLACVLGDMDLVRPLGKAGIRCAVVGAPGDSVGYSRFVKVHVDTSGSETETELLDALLRWARRAAREPVLFFESDWHLQVISRHRERLSEFFRFTLAEAALVEQLIDKASFAALAARMGLPVPRSISADPAVIGVEALHLAFPVVVKPVPRRTPCWDQAVPRQHAKAIGVPTPEALNTLWTLLQASGIKVLVQELVPGPESRIESYHVYVDASGEIVGDFTGRKIRTYPVEYGSSSALVTTDAQDVAALGRDVVRRLNLRGVAKLDFKRAPNGSLLLLEVNPRFNLWHHLGAVAGVNLPALVYGDMTRRPRPRVGTARAGVSWCAPWRDYRAAREAGIPVRRWLRWVASCEALSLIAVDDPLPFAVKVWGRAMDSA